MYKKPFKRYSRKIQRKSSYAIAKKPRPFRSRYDGDAFIKVENQAYIVVQGNTFWSGARTDNATSTANTDASYLDVPEY